MVTEEKPKVVVEEAQVGTDEQDVIIQQMLQDAQRVPEPGMAVGDVQHRGTDDLPVTMMASTVTSAGYVPIWNTQTGERSLTNRNMLPSQLKKVRKDGSRVFTIYKPSIEPVRGTYRCMLHAEVENREHYNTMGLATCPKANLTSPFQVERHMRSRHKVEWETLERERTERERNEDRAFQRQILTMAQGTVQNTVQVSNQAPYHDKGTHIESCPDCQMEFVAASLKQAQNKVRLHRRVHTRSQSQNDHQDTTTQEA